MEITGNGAGSTSFRVESTVYDINVEEKLLEIAFTRMVLGNELSVDFAFPMSSLELTDGAYAKVVKEYADEREDVTQTILFKDWGQTDINGDGDNDHYYISFDGVAGKEMSDKLYATIYNAEGEAISETYEDSVRDYVMRNLTDVASEQNTIMVDMLNYGAAAQGEFGYALDDLANKDLTDAQQEMATKSVPECDDSTAANAQNYYGTRLILENKILMNTAFRGVTEGMTAKYSFTDHYGKFHEGNADVVIEGSFGIVEIDALVVADGCCDVTITVYDSDGNVHASVTDSMQRYTTRMDDRGEVYKAIMKFSASAYAYFH